MAFHGLFVGIDRYASPMVDELRCATRDARALSALFGDTFDSDTTLLTDADATRSRIEAEFQRLMTTVVDDVVVIAFSGHGSETHQLVTHDADVDNLSETCIELATLTEWFASIPARRLVCILDCCFSGGMGTKVLQVPTKPRSLASTENLLEQLSGEGRLILTASRADEEAWENGRVGHGLLTYYLLEALQGAEEVQQAGKIPVYRLLDFVTQRVTADAAKFGARQHPTLKGTIDQELAWPVFVRGVRYARAFPERAAPPVTADLASLQPYGFPDELIGAWGNSIPSLNQLQIDAINDFDLLDGKDLVVSAPTSSGKTLIGELAALHAVLDRKRSIFLLPLKALVNDKHQYFQRTYGSFGLRVIRCTGEIHEDVSALLRGQYDVCLMTYEKFSNVLLANHHVLGQVSTVVIDEVQMIADPSRGVNLEFLLTFLRMQQISGSGPQVVALSAVIGDTNGFEKWLAARLLRRIERPVPLDEGVIRSDGSFRYIDPDGKECLQIRYSPPEFRKGSSQDWIIPLVRRLVKEGKQVIVFRETKGDAQGCSLYLAGALDTPAAERTLALLPTGDPTNASLTLRRALERGVALHTSDLDREERLVVEEEFRRADSEIRVIAATTTLAMGVNTPAEAVIIAGLVHPGKVPYTVAEYKNMVGRAGRLGLAERGTSYLIATSPLSEGQFWKAYVLGKPEDLKSHFLSDSTDPRAVIIRVLASVPKNASRGLKAEEIIQFLESSFGAYQQSQRFSQWSWDPAGTVKALRQLETHRLVELQPDGTYRLTELGRVVGEAGLSVVSVLQLVAALETASPTSITDPTLIAACQLTTELEEVYLPLNSRSTNAEPQAWFGALAGQQIAPGVERALRAGALLEGTKRAKKTAACLMWVSGKPLAEIERHLTQFAGRERDAAGPLRAVAARTCDVLPTVGRIACILHPELQLAERLPRLHARLEVGVPGSAADLARFAGSRLSRSDYMRLIEAGLVSADSLSAAQEASLLSCVAGSTQKLELLMDYVTAQQEKPSSPAAIHLPTYEG